MTSIRTRSPWRRRWLTALSATLAALCCTSALSLAAPADASNSVFPPWQDGRNNDATNRGLEFTVPQVDVLADFHGDLTAPKLVLYVGGNYFFVIQTG